MIIATTGALVYSYEVNQHIISKTEAIDIVLKTDNCTSHSWQLVNTEAYLYHIKNGIEYRVDENTMHDSPTDAVIVSDKQKTEYEWQVILMCYIDNQHTQTSIIQWLHANSGNFVD